MNTLKAFRILYGLKQEELARIVGRSQPWISLVEGGKLLPQREEAKKIARALKVDPAAFFLS